MVKPLNNKKTMYLSVNKLNNLSCLYEESLQSLKKNMKKLLRRIDYDIYEVSIETKYRLIE